MIIIKLLFLKRRLGRQLLAAILGPPLSALDALETGSETSHL
jgi:hypothetical protein